jgi:cytochrome c-type biogenesis protein CcmH/NrfF
VRRVTLFAWLVVIAITPSRMSALAGQQSTDTTAYRVSKDSVLEARTSAVAAQLRCPVCQGLSLQDSPSELAQSMRAVVRDQLAQGKTPDEVKAYFVSKYGEWILLAPKASGFNLIAYAAPILIVLGGGAGIFVAVRRWTSNAESVPQQQD